MNEDPVKTAARELVIPLIEKFEGYRSHAYKDSVGVWTIGYGTTHYPNAAPVQPGDTCTKEQAREWLLQDLAHFERCVDQYVKVPLNAHQRAALLSWTYNLGCGSLRKSTMLRRINAGEFERAAEELKRWNKAGGHTLAGLVNRREAEAREFLA